MRTLKWFGWPEKAKPKCTNTLHVGPFEPAPEIQAWLEKWSEGKVPTQVQCMACGSHTNAVLAGLEKAS